MSVCSSEDSSSSLHSSSSHDGDDDEYDDDDNDNATCPNPTSVTVFWNGKKSVHVADCKRIKGQDLSTYTKMTLLESEEKGLSLCSKCPKPTAAEGQGGGLLASWVNPPPAPKDKWKPQKHDFVPSKYAPLIQMKEGKIKYRPFSERGDRLMDFSICGYKQSAVPIPNDVPIVETLEPTQATDEKQDKKLAYPQGTDSHKLIQQAIDRVAAIKTAHPGKPKGAVLLKRGTWFVNETIKVRDGVLLKGEGNGEDGTVLIFNMKGNQGTAIQLGQSHGKCKNLRVKTTVADEYVPTGKNKFTLENAEGLK
eukprot:scaffold3952_cov111-Amphora_coffeaeformis.AAC.1